MKIKETYTETYKKEPIDKEVFLKVVNDKKLSGVVMNKRGMCLVDGVAKEFMTTTALFDINDGS